MAFVETTNSLSELDLIRPRTRSMTYNTREATGKRHQSVFPPNRSKNEKALVESYKQIRQIQNHQNHTQEQMNGSHTSAVSITVPKPRVYLSRKKIKRVPVTSCDTCRFRKLRCNSKELREGEKCSQCTKSGIPCTFDDRDEMLQLPKVVKNTSSRKKKQNCSQQGDYIKNGSQMLLAANYSPYPQHPALAANNWTYNNLTSNNNAHQVTSINLDRTDNLQTHLDYSAISLQSFQKPVHKPWQEWNLPSHLTNNQTGATYGVEPEQMIDYLINRFYQDNSFLSVILPDRGYTHKSVIYGSIHSLPSFLLQTMLACAAWSSSTAEPEIVAWRDLAWSNATQSVHDHLGNTIDNEVELIQALLLLCTVWPGDLVRVERINTLDAAIGVATNKGLQNSSQLAGTPESQSLRLVLFWSLYCLDKILCAATGRVPSLPNTCHDMPLPTSENLFSLCIPGLSTELAWIQRLSISFIKLCQLLEEIHSNLFEPIAMRWMTSLQEVLVVLHELEAKLEQFCREHRWFLSNITSFSTPHKAIAEAVITLMHLTQLQLYIAPLKFEVSLSKVRPMDFSLENQKSLTATIESAWHLVQQALRENRSIDAKTEKSMSLSLAALHFGANAFRFLATSWIHWQGGTGCVPYAPGSTLEMGNGPLDSKETGDRGVDAGNELNQAHQTYTSSVVTSTVRPGLSIVGSHAQQNSRISKERLGHTAELTDLTIHEGNNDMNNDTAAWTSEVQGVQVIEVSSKPGTQRIDGVSEHPTSPSSLAMCTPARLLFKDSEPVHEVFSRLAQPSNEQIVGESGQISSSAYRQIDDCQKMHAMLAPMDPSLVNEMSKLESLLFSEEQEAYPAELWPRSVHSHISEHDEEERASANGSSNYIHGPSSSNNSYGTSNLTSVKQQCRTIPDSHFLPDNTSNIEQREKAASGLLASQASFAPRVVQ